VMLVLLLLLLLVCCCTVWCYVDKLVVRRMAGAISVVVVSTAALVEQLRGRCPLEPLLGPAARVRACRHHRGSIPNLLETCSCCTKKHS